jgi:hypothetical protein
MGSKNSQDWENIYVLPFKTIAIMAKLVLSHLYECQGIQIKNPFDKILNFNLIPLKVNTYCIRLNQFGKGLSKGFI